MKIKLLLVAIILCCMSSIKAQLNVGSATAPNANAMLQVSSTNKGLLLPQVALVQTTSSLPLTANVAGMVVYNTATINDVTPGLYINDGTKWMPMNTSTPLL